MKKKLRIGIVAHRFECLGGIQTLVLELIAGLNEVGIVPDIVWDEPQDWGILGDPDVQATFGGGRLGISSSRLRSLPSAVALRLHPYSVGHARFDLERYDFVYCFEPGVRMPPGLPNLCWIAGPAFLRLPGDRVDWRRLWGPGELKRILSDMTNPLTKPDKHSSYVTHSEFIADLIHERYGFRPPVIWPPARSRKLPPPPADRSGFLFLSRLETIKRADTVLTLAKAFPEQRFTLAGVVMGGGREYVAGLRHRMAAERIANVVIVKNPSETEVASLLVSHEVFVFPAHYEHFGIVTVEAILAGLLPLVHDTGGQREIVPYDFLRFLSNDDLVNRARFALKMAPAERGELIEKLQRHAERGTPRRYREEMLQKIRDIPALRDGLDMKS
jgi:glycosyltransferase involved in cell wall biosynthesis